MSRRRDHSSENLKNSNEAIGEEIHFTAVGCGYTK
jgi:hypothetical protein